MPPIQLVVCCEENTKYKTKKARANNKTPSRTGLSFINVHNTPIHSEEYRPPTIMLPLPKAVKIRYGKINNSNKKESPIFPLITLEINTDKRGYNCNRDHASY